MAPRTYLRKHPPAKISKSAMAINALIATNMVKNCHSKGHHINDYDSLLDNSVCLNKTDDTFTRLAKGKNYNEVQFTSDKAPYESLTISRTTMDSLLLQSDKTSSKVMLNSTNFNGLNDGCINKSLKLIQSWEDPKHEFVTQRKKSKRKCNIVKAKSFAKVKSMSATRMSASNIIIGPEKKNSSGARLSNRLAQRSFNGFGKQDVTQSTSLKLRSRVIEEGIIRTASASLADAELGMIPFLQDKANYLKSLHDDSVRQETSKTEILLQTSRLQDSSIPNESCLPSTNNSVCDISNFMVKHASTPFHKPRPSRKRLEEIVSDSPSVFRQTRAKTYQLRNKTDTNSINTTNGENSTDSAIVKKSSQSRPKISPKFEEIPKGSPFHRRQSSKMSRSGSTKIDHEIPEEFTELSSIYPIERGRRLRPHSCPTTREHDFKKTIEEISSGTKAKRRSRNTKVDNEVQDVFSKLSTTIHAKRGRPKSCPSKHPNKKVSTRSPIMKKRRSRSVKIEPEVENDFAETFSTSPSFKIELRSRSCTPKQLSLTKDVSVKLEGSPSRRRSRGRPRKRQPEIEETSILSEPRHSRNCLVDIKSEIALPDKTTRKNHNYDLTRSPVALRTRSRSHSYSIINGSSVNLSNKSYGLNDFEISSSTRRNSRRSSRRRNRTIENEEQNKSKILPLTPSHRVTRGRNTVVEERSLRRNEDKSFVSPSPLQKGIRRRNTIVEEQSLSQNDKSSVRSSDRILRRRNTVVAERSLSRYDDESADKSFVQSNPAHEVSRRRKTVAEERSSSRNSNKYPIQRAVREPIVTRLQGKKNLQNSSDTTTNQISLSKPTIKNCNIDLDLNHENHIPVSTNCSNNNVWKIYNDKTTNCAPYMTINDSSLLITTINSSIQSIKQEPEDIDAEVTSPVSQINNNIEDIVRHIKNSPLSISSGHDEITSQCLYINSVKQNDPFAVPSIPARKVYLPGKKYRRSILERRETVNEHPNLLNTSVNSASSASSRRSTIRLVPVSLHQNQLGANNIKTENPGSPKRLLQRRSTIYVGCHSIEQAVEVSERSDSLLDESVDEKVATKTAREIVLRNCDQDKPEPWDTYYPDRMLKNCSKIGEGVYGEVFMVRNAKRTTSVLKVIPIEGDQIVNGEPQKKFQDILSELIIAKKLSSLQNPGFNRLEAAHLVCGAYPEKLLDLWHLYDEAKRSENDCPDGFQTESQLYLILQLEHGGKDLEAFQFKNSIEAYSIFVQLAHSLAQAEQHFAFEHRDLHWGNVLISKCPTMPTITYILPDSSEHTINTHGVQCNIIDFTLSRMTVPGGKGVVNARRRCSTNTEEEDWVLYNDLKEDDGLFEGEGDVQFDVYRQMKTVTGNDWKQFCPKTNVYWLKYILQKMLTEIMYSEPETRSHKSYLNKMRRCRSRMDMFSNCADVVQSLT